MTVTSALASGALVTAGWDGRLFCWPSGVREPARRGARPGGEDRPAELRQRARAATLAMTTLPCGDLVTATGNIGVVRRWPDLSPGAWPDEIGVHRGWVLALVALDGGRLAAVGGDHVTLWDLRVGREQRIDLNAGMHGTDAAALPTGDLTVLGSDGSFRVVGIGNISS